MFHIAHGNTCHLMAAPVFLAVIKINHKKPENLTDFDSPLLGRIEASFLNISFSISKDSFLSCWY